MYLYGCDKIEGSRFGCRVARVPSDGLHERSAYEFWDGSGWNPDIERAVFALDGPNGGLSVSWNPWLHRYLAVYLAGYSNEVLMRTAERPEGPWSAPVVAFRGVPPAARGVNYGAFEHPELSSDGGRDLVVTYFHPLGPLQGEIRVSGFGSGSDGVRVRRGDDRGAGRARAGSGRRSPTGGTSETPRTAGTWSRSCSPRCGRRSFAPTRSP